MQEINLLGNAGENAAAYLASNGRSKLAIQTIHNSTARSDSLAYELDAWMNMISPGIKIIAEEIPSVQMVKMGFRFETETG